MGMLGDIGRRLKKLVGRSRFDRELDDEMRLHLELREAQLRGTGVPQPEAYRAARRRFGNVRRLREESREAWGRKWLEQTAQDVRIGVRTLVRNPAFTLTAVSTLALGIGANTALFTVVNAVVFRPLPFPEPGRLVRVVPTDVLGGVRGTAVSNVGEIRQQSTSFEALAGCEVTARYLRAAAGSERVMAVQAERDFFSVLGVQPIRGRTFESADPTTVVVIGERFWNEQLGGQASAIGSTIVLDDQPFTIIGVMADSFQFPYRAASLLPGVGSEARTDLWIPVELRPRSRIGNVTARLKPNVSLEVAESELAVIARRLEAQYPETNKGRGIKLVPLSDAVVEATVRRPLFVLFGAVGLVLALACANVANLLLVRMTVRSREVAVRSALGAGRLRLARQFLTESLILSLAGGALGLALGWWGTEQLMSAGAAQIPRAHEIGLDWRVFLFLLLACTVTAVALGLAPALIAARRDAQQSVLKESGSHATMGRRQRRLRDALVVAEVALAFVLAVGATLLIRELVRLRHTETGLVSRNVITFHIGHGRMLKTDVRQFYEIADRVAQLPGVRAAGFTQMLPLQSWGWYSNSSDFRLRHTPPRLPLFEIELRYVTPGYFQALGIPIRKGRGLTTADTREAPAVILINEALARRSFGDEDPIGKETTRGTIVGVVGDVRQVKLDLSAAPELYYPIAQNWSQVSELGLSLVVSTRDRPEAIVDAVRTVVRDVNPYQAIFRIKTMDRVIADSLSDFILYLSLMGVSAALALLLASTGTYGVIAYIAASRMREFAIRVALGADKTRVTRLVVGQGLGLTAIGLGIGLFGAFAATPLLRNLPVTVRPPDVATIAPIALLIAIVAIAACLVPARRAARSDPMSVLRSE